MAFIFILNPFIAVSLLLYQVLTVIASPYKSEFLVVRRIKKWLIIKFIAWKAISMLLMGSLWKKLNL